MDPTTETPVPTPGASDEVHEDACLGDKIGPYRIVRWIASGGMGRVYLALRENDYRQQVALKLIDRGPEKIDILERFLQERQILARLEHPNIARILDGGTAEDALPYFAMEYVEGERIDRYCEVHDLSLSRRLELFREICRAVHFAHRNLIVHRDLKPGNILVTDEGIPKLVDFGIAQPVDAQPVDEGDAAAWEGKAPMTPAYASPEQILGEPVTTAADIYSLGVLLYKLVSGRHPYPVEGDSGSKRAVLRQICEVDPPPPSTVVDSHARRRQLAGEIDAIVLKAMQKEPGERYESALQLAEDLRRQAADLPVKAYRGGWLYRARKRARRHRAAVVLGLALLTFAVTASGLWRKAVHGESLAQTARVEAEAARARSEDARRRTEKISGFLVDLFRSADPDAGSLSVREILNRGREKLAADLEDEPEIRAELLTTLGTVYNNLALYEEARELKEEALRNRRAADPSDRADLANDLNNLGRLYFDLGDYDSAADYVAEAVAMWRRLGPDPEALVCLRNLAVIRAQTGRIEEASELYREILDLQRRFFAEDDVEVAKSLYALGSLHRTRGEPDTAEPLLRRALEVSTSKLGPRHTTVASIRGTLGRVLHAQGRHAEARASLESSLALRLEVLGEDHVRVAHARKNLAALLLDLGETEEAGELLEAALRVLREKKPAGHWTVADAESLWGVYLAARDRYEEAEPFVLGGYRVIREAKGDDDVATVDAKRRVEKLHEEFRRLSP